jgi:hypothetical protein
LLHYKILSTFNHTVSGSSVHLSELAPGSQLFTILPEREKAKEASKRQTAEKTTSLSNTEITEQRLHEVDSSTSHSTAQEGYHNTISKNLLRHVNYTRKEVATYSWQQRDLQHILKNSLVER